MSGTETADDIAGRVAGIDWGRVASALEESGWALIEQVLTPAACNALAALYPRQDCFRSRVVMAHHGFGQGEYKYFSYPLPDLVAALRRTLYPRLVPIANRWAERMGTGARYPDDHAAYIERCRRSGQTKPTPLLLRYGEDDYNCLHQDLYGEQVFPMQAVFLLSAPGADFTGGEFVLTEQRPRMQSRAAVVPLRKGDAVVFAVHQRPQRGTRGFHRVTMRHGVSRLRAGERYTAGIIFHDAA